MHDHLGWRDGAQVQILKHTTHSETMHVNGDVPQIPQIEPVRHRNVPTGCNAIQISAQSQHEW
jgi:hypothetical protein